MNDATLEIRESIPLTEPYPALLEPSDRKVIYDTACFLSSGCFIDLGGTPQTPLDD